MYLIYINMSMFTDSVDKSVVHHTTQHTHGHVDLCGEIFKTYIADTRRRVAKDYNR